VSSNGDDELQRALRFIHMLEAQGQADLRENNALLYALVEELVARGNIDLHALEERRERTRVRENERAGAIPHIQIGPNIDKYKLDQLPVIDCEARIPLCQARCCTFAFPLTPQDLDERVVAWDYGRPYQIRRRADGYCTHNDPQTRACTIHAQRPGVCRNYDCRNDKRIWEDFDARIPAGPENKP
jgi:Fe-S-cluster containining protein